MKTLGRLSLLFLGCWLVTAAPSVSADVAPGDIIDKTSWQKAEGLLPGPVLNWVQKGDFIMEIGELNYKPADYFPPFAKEAMQTNLGKYGLGEDDGIIEAATGKAPERLVGLPFPQIDPDDPKLAIKLMQNNHYMQYLPGNLRFPYQGIFVDRSRGYDKETEAVWLQMAMDGYPGAAELPNPERVEKYAITRILKPYDVAGTAVMLWRFLDPTKLDLSFGYVPAIRRVRRMSPANRSDAFMGSDFAVDDANGYDGKVSAFSWKVLRKQEALLAFLDKDPIRIVQNEQGEWLTTPQIKPVIHGYQKEGWQGAPWAPTNLIWTKRSVYVLEMIPKDPYYNYGPQELWVDTELYGAAYKVIHDKSRAYWKTFFISSMGCESADKKMMFTSLATQQVVDDRADHSSIIEDASPRNIWAFYAIMDPNDFSLSGFQKFCK
ncbi:MAG: DUF1329 domain-containing protein [bacterium]